MKRSVEVEVRHMGFKVGTIGWLTEEIDRVKIGQTTGGDPAAWLLLKDGSSHLLAIFDPYNVGDQMPDQQRVIEVERHACGMGPECDLILTDAAWTLFLSLAEQAAAMANALLTEDAEMAPRMELVPAN
uniref:Uncharacterized protein n=1 Tax=viral metagenome TaxID=1070528 RepID=A0A6M3LSG3_9ZZZZ